MLIVNCACCFLYQVKNGTTGWVDAGKSVTVQVPYPENIKYEMKDLHADTVYRVELRAHNIIGYSGPAEIMLRTAKGKSTRV